jgi:hypothetical protein
MDFKIIKLACLEGNKHLKQKIPTRKLISNSAFMIYYKQKLQI